MSFASLPADARLSDGEPEAQRLLGGTPGPRMDPQTSQDAAPRDRARNSRVREWGCVLLGAVALVLATVLVVTRSRASRATAGAHDASLQIQVSESDDRQYRFTALDNGLEVLLVSDPATSRSAAAMDVRVGHFSDPDDLPGLAHFLEHMLFLGTKKFPREDYFEELLTRHGGSSNAYTAAEDTNFFFDVDPNHFREALDAWSQFFVAPLFSANATDREIHAVDSEHSKNQQVDDWRISQLLSSTSNPAHPFHKFGTGNLDTLQRRPHKAGVDVRKALLKFYEEHYSANLMRLCVLGKEPLDELEALVESLFEGVPNHNLAAPSFGKHPVRRADSMGRIYSVRSIDDQRRLQLYWLLPPQVPQYRSKSMDVIASLIGHEGMGSLLSHLRQRGWANGILAGADDEGSDFTWFKVDLSLTERGLAHVASVIESVFAYVALLTSQGVEQWRWVESKNLAQLEFRFLEKSDPADYASELASRMQLYPPADVISAPYLFDEWDPDGVKSLLQEMSPDRVVAFVISSSFKPSQLRKREPWYGTRYAEDLITPSQLRAWAAPPEEVLGHMALPSRNTFIPTDLALRLKAAAQPVGKPTDFPVVVSDTDRLRMWFAPDAMYNRPRANLYFAFRSPVTADTPRARVLSLLFCDVFADAFKEESYPAHVAGVSYTIDATPTGFAVLVSGYNDRLADFLMLFLQRLHTITIDEARFPALLERLRRSLENLDNVLSVRVASHRLSALLEDRAFSTDELREAAGARITAAHVRTLARNAFATMYIEAMVQGNIGESDARSIAVQVTETLTFKPLPAARLVALSTRRLPAGRANTYWMAVPNKDEPNSAAAVEYQIGPETVKDRVLLSLLASWLDERAFNQLRTVEQLGYIAGASSKLRNGVLSLVVYVQSSHKDPLFLRGRIEAFVASIGDALQALQPQDFDALRASRARQLLAPYDSQSSMADAMWEEVDLGRYAFNRPQESAALLMRIALDDVVRLYQGALAGRRTRKMVVGVFGSGRDIPEGQATVKSVKAFRRAKDRWPSRARLDIPDATEISAQAKADGESATEALEALEEEERARDAKAGSGSGEPGGPAAASDGSGSDAVAATGATGATGANGAVTRFAKSFASAESPDDAPSVSAIPDVPTLGFAVASAEKEAARERQRLAQAAANASTTAASARSGRAASGDGQNATAAVEAEKPATEADGSGSAPPPWARRSPFSSAPLAQSLPGGLPFVAGAIGPEEAAGVGSGADEAVGDGSELAKLEAAERQEEERERLVQAEEAEEEAEMERAAQAEERMALARDAEDARVNGGGRDGPPPSATPPEGGIDPRIAMMRAANDRAEMAAAYQRWLAAQQEQEGVARPMEEAIDAVGRGGGEGSSSSPEGRGPVRRFRGGRAKSIRAKRAL